MAGPSQGTGPSAGCREDALDFMTRRAVRCLKVTFTVAVSLNLVEAVGDPGGAVWTAVRLAATAAFTLALVACAVLWVLRWRRAGD
jgi:hypothetical protein